jgi:hypothetical protein
MYCYRDDVVAEAHGRKDVDKGIARIDYSVMPACEEISLKFPERKEIRCSPLYLEYMG